MAKGVFRCGKCTRSFSMAAHLARHMNTIHGAKRKGKAAGRKKKMKRRVGRPKGSRAGLGTRPGLAALGRVSAWGHGSARVIGMMQAYHNELLAQRAAMDAQIDAFARAMETVGATPRARRGRPRGAKGRPRGARGRPRSSGFRPGSLKDFVLRVLARSARPMSPNDIGVGVKKAGFQTKAKDITKAVSNALPALKNVKKVGFGMYQLSR